LEAAKVNDQQSVLSDLENAEVNMKLAYSCINAQDYDNARKYLQEARRLYAQLKKEAEIKIIDSTIAKLSLMSKK
jgi:hypothetical protein